MSCSGSALLQLDDAEFVFLRPLVPALNMEQKIDLVQDL